LLSRIHIFTRLPRKSYKRKETLQCRKELASLPVHTDSKKSTKERVRNTGTTRIGAQGPRYGGDTHHLC